MRSLSTGSSAKRATVEGMIVIAASIVIQASLGGVYAWSVFVPPLREAFNLTAGQAGIIFGVSIAAFTLTMLVSGPLQEARGPRPVAALGGLVFGAGYVTASLSGGAFPLLLLGVGVLTGAGIGLAYVCPLATCIKWFPERKGLITGIAVAGFGSGAILLSNLVEFLLGRGVGILSIFRIVGIGFGALVVAGAMFLHTPPGGAGTAVHSRTGNLPLLRQRGFLALTAGMFAGTFGGLLVVGNLKPMALAAGLAGNAAAWSVSVFAVANAVGRIFWGLVHDRIGRAAIPFKLGLLALGALGFCLAHGSLMVMASTVAVGAAFGGCFVLYAAEVAAIYGPGRVGTVYPKVFLIYGASGLLAPAMGGRLFDLFGTYAGANALSVFVALSGILVIRSLWAAKKPVPGV